MAPTFSNPENVLMLPCDHCEHDEPPFVSEPDTSWIKTQTQKEADKYAARNKKKKKGEKLCHQVVTQSKSSVHNNPIRQQHTWRLNTLLLLFFLERKENSRSLSVMMKERKVSSFRILELERISITQRSLKSSLISFQKWKRSYVGHRLWHGLH
nr:hypothetical protein [uncultured bacterium]